MAAAYDNFDYPSYWEGREYEHKSEVLAIKKLLQEIQTIDRFLEIGGGYGRLIPSYIYRSKRVVFTDPSAKLLSIAKTDTKAKNVKYIQSKIENLKGKVKAGTFDVVLCVRVLHHIQSIEELFQTSENFLKKGGYFLLEYPNKRHFKAVLSEFVRGNLTFYSDIFPKDLSAKNDTLPFVNYHPDEIEMKLHQSGFEIISLLSVSNIRSEFLKKHLPLEFVLWLEKLLQKPLSKVRFGPSMFLLAKKR
ncbi:class I SAM-dependent methyltransferase [Patescibacteria group bacterium]